MVARHAPALARIATDLPQRTPPRPCRLALDALLPTSLTDLSADMPRIAPATALIAAQRHGVQLVGRRGSERILLDVAARLEDTLSLSPLADAA